jgi:hypothetical protein
MLFSKPVSAETEVKAISTLDNAFHAPVNVSRGGFPIPWYARCRWGRHDFEFSFTRLHLRECHCCRRCGYTVLLYI